MTSHLGTGRGQQGLTLVELLVAMAVMAVIGAAITQVTTGLLQTTRFSSDMRDKVEQTRLAVERVRETLRAADEVCSNSDGTSVVVWLDADADALYSAGETVTFRVVEVGGDHVLQRQDGSGTPRGIVGNVRPPAEFGEPYFDYDVDPAVQGTDLLCQPSVSTTGVEGTRTETVALAVPIRARNEADLAAAEDLVVRTSVTARNAGLLPSDDTTTTPVTGGNQAPSVEISSVSCTDLSCTFVADASDPDGDPLTYEWDFGDLSGTGVSASPAYTYGSHGGYTVTVIVRDGRGGTASDVRNIVLTEFVAFTMHVGDLDDLSTLHSSGGSWIPRVEVEVHDGAHAALDGVVVSGTFGSSTEERTCSTVDGRCVIAAPCVHAPGKSGGGNCGSAASNVTFAVTALARSDWSYAPDAFHDPDADNAADSRIELVVPEDPA